jgi:hypothetical protein
MKLEFSLQIFEESSNIKFRENQFIWSRIVPCGRTERQEDITKLLVAFRNFANAPKKEYNSEMLNALRQLWVSSVVSGHSIVSTLEWYATTHSTLTGNTGERLSSDAAITAQENW